MRRLALLLAGLLAPIAAAAQFPTPTFDSVTVNNNASAGTLTVSGASTLSGGGTLGGTFAGPTILQQVTPSLTPVTTGTLPANPAPGTMVSVSDCLNGSQTVGFGTGCPYYADSNRTWQPMPTIPTLAVTVGGQGIRLGGATTNQGNGSKIQLSSGSTTSGHCAQFDANGNTVDSGGACGGGGGSGTVTAGTINQLGYYAASGTTISGLAIVNSGVPSYSAGGVLSVATTLPSGLTVPSPTISGPTITGSGTYVALTGSGKLVTAASAVGSAGLNLPQGSAPTTPVNGDVWMTSAGMFTRANGATAGPLVGLTSFSATAPVTYNNSTGVFACATCATTTNGGALTATSPMAISAAGVISLGTTIGASEFFADSTVTVHNDTYPIPADTWPWTTGTIDSVTYYTSGTSTPSFTIALQINGVNVTSCNGIVVSSATRTTTTCTALNAITTGQHATLVISGTSGAPTSALVQINYHHSNN